jgi:hypothetical protein
MASADALFLLRNNKMHYLALASETVSPMDEVLQNLAIEQGGSDVKATTHENRNVASLDAPKTMDDKPIHLPRPVEDVVHQEDAPYIKERKGQ